MVTFKQSSEFRKQHQETETGVGWGTTMDSCSPFSSEGDSFLFEQT